MKLFLRRVSANSKFAWILVLPFGVAAAPETAPQSTLPFAHCFAPGTPPEVVQRYAERASWGTPGHSLSDSGTKFQFEDVNRWTSTAVDGSGLGQGSPTTLTWSIVPDGTSIFGYNGEPTSGSDLRAFLTGIYGSEAAWLAIFQQVFDRWGELTGIDYVYEPNDDGSPWQSSGIATGRLGVRGDIRIAGHPLDGNGGVLAYNFYPNYGDMVLDTSDSFFTFTGSNSLGLRNTLAHEHGHGLGLGHVCPINQTKLMEPFISFAFDGPQHDEVLAANRGYGDHDENNDSPGTAMALGLTGAMPALENRSIDDDSDVDYYRFDVTAGNTVDVTVTPVGSTYASGPQSGSCSNAPSFDSLSIHDLSFRILTTNGSIVMAEVDAAGAGQAEVLAGFGAAGSYLLEVSGQPGTNAAQLYRLEISSGASSTIFEDGFETGNVSRWK